jgi:hypothetical protein
MISTNNSNYIYCGNNNNIFIINDTNIPNSSGTKLVASDQVGFTINNKLSEKIEVYYIDKITINADSSINLPLINPELINSPNIHLIIT